VKPIFTRGDIVGVKTGHLANYWVYGNNKRGKKEIYVALLIIRAMQKYKHLYHKDNLTRVSPY
jgi:hypothetical protein